jgi:hypothetical protein
MARPERQVEWLGLELSVHMGPIAGDAAMAVDMVKQLRLANELAAER